MNAIIYTTNTGSTERSARLLAQETGFHAYSLAEAKQKVHPGAEVIYLGWIMASTVMGYAAAARRCEKDPDGFERFEAIFPKKEKRKLPGQLY